jgi:hypothetical protein
MNTLRGSEVSTSIKEGLWTRYSKDWANSSSTIKLAFERESRHGALLCVVCVCKAVGIVTCKVSGVTKGVRLRLMAKLITKSIQEFVGTLKEKWRGQSWSGQSATTVQVYPFACACVYVRYMTCVPHTVKAGNGRYIATHKTLAG